MPTSFPPQLCPFLIELVLFVGWCRSSSMPCSNVPKQLQGEADVVHCYSGPVGARADCAIAKSKVTPGT